MSNNKIKTIIFFLILMQNSIIFSQCEIPNYLINTSWDDTTYWTLDRDNDSVIDLANYTGLNNDGIRIDYHLSPNDDSFSYVRMIYDSVEGYTENNPVVFLIKAHANDNIELKFVDEDGSVFGKLESIKDRYYDWNHVVIYLKDTNYWWGGDSLFGNLSSFEIAISGDSSGTIWIDEMGIGIQGLLSGLYLDPCRGLPGDGFRQRRSECMINEDTLVLRYLKVLQDSSSGDKQLLPNAEGEILVSTFNNSLAAMSFMISNERQRAERILDFYAAAIDSNNTDLQKQDFFYNGEARGFYQQIKITDYTRGGENEDRWIGDIAWLLFAYKLYEQQYGIRIGYPGVINIIKDLLISFFREIDIDCGCIQTGWQDGDARFDTTCHNEGNIDAYAALKLCGEEELAAKVKNWLDKTLTGNDLPLDNYTWRVLAYSQQGDSLLNIPEFDFRFRKKVIINNDSLYGFYPFPDIAIENIWVEGSGHMACALLHYGDKERGYFYANQLDPLLLSYSLYGTEIKTLTYAYNRSGGYAWIDTTKGYVSPAAWYIFAKNGFNPLKLNFVDCNLCIITNIHEHSIDNKPDQYELNQNYPNPFNPVTKISYRISNSCKVTLTVYDLLGREIKTLVNRYQKAGDYNIHFNAENLSSGIYFCKLQAGNEIIETKKMLLLR